MDARDAIRGRRAVRLYRHVPLGCDLIQGVVEDAVWAPSGMNQQPWRFFVIEGRERLARYSAKAKAVLLEEDGLEPAMREMLEQPSFNIFYDAPTLVVVAATQAGEMAVKDCCLAAGSLMLSAFARGLGTCWVGFAEPWLNAEQTKRDLRVPASMRLVAPLIIGWPQGETTAPPRRAPEIIFVEPVSRD